MQPQTVIFIGPQGSGKGTQVQNLMAHLKFLDSERSVSHIQTGQAFRALREEGGYTAARVLDLIDHGELVPDFLTNAMVVEQLRREMTDNSHVIFDGFPRNLSQANLIDDILVFYMRNQLSVVYLDTPDEVVRERMRKRGRIDDTDEVIDERLRLYNELTEPLIEYYQKHSSVRFVTIDGAQTVDQVKTAMIAGLEL